MDFLDSLSGWDIERWNDFAQVIAISLAAVFVVYKFLSGYFYPDLEISLELDRRHKSIGVGVVLQKGSRGALKLVDAQICVRNAREPSVHCTPSTKVSGLNRPALGYGYSSEISWVRTSRIAAPYRLAPGERTAFSALVDVEENEVYLIDFALYGKRDFSWMHSYWRATAISLPVESGSCSTSLSANSKSI